MALQVSASFGDAIGEIAGGMRDASDRLMRELDCSLS
jgi:hypothetical protein